MTGSLILSSSHSQAADMTPINPERPSRSFMECVRGFFNCSERPETLKVGGAFLGLGIGLGIAAVVVAVTAASPLAVLVLGGLAAGAVVAGIVLLSIRAYQSRRAPSSENTNLPVQPQSTSSASEISTVVRSGEGVDNETFKPDPKGDLAVEELIIASAAPALLHGSEGEGDSTRL